MKKREKKKLGEEAKMRSGEYTDTPNPRKMFHPIEQMYRPV